MQLFFYELHEGATDLMTDALLVSDRDHTPDQFEAIVKAARAAVIDTFEEDTLVEAIARGSIVPTALPTSAMRSCADP